MRSVRNAYTNYFILSSWHTSIIYTVLCSVSQISFQPNRFISIEFLFLKKIINILLNSQSISIFSDNRKPVVYSDMAYDPTTGTIFLISPYSAYAKVSYFNVKDYGVKKRPQLRPYPSFRKNTMRVRMFMKPNNLHTDPIEFFSVMKELKNTTTNGKRRIQL